MVMPSRSPERSSSARAAKRTASRSSSGNKADYVLMDDLVVQYIVNNYPNEAKTQERNVGSKPPMTWPVALCRQARASRRR